jgi:diguanylate cyclase (GGDEF)-like protein
VTTSGSRLGALRRLPRDPQTFYAISDMATARRMGGVLWIFGGLILAVLLAAWPPTGRVGGWGWAIGAGAVVACLVSAVPLLRSPERVSPDALLAMSYGSVALLTLMVWAGGHPYAEIYILPVLYAAAAHPPRRVALFFVAVASALLLPLAYDGWNSELAAESLASLLLWFAMAFAALVFSATVRVKRLEMAADEQEASALARRDPLTGLGNRRAFDEALSRIVAGDRQADRHLTLLLADIEGFKSVNDTYGHLEGDRCLREVATALASTVRPGDRCFRWGGDEFALLLPGTDSSEADSVIDRISDAVATDVAAPGDSPMRLRFGAAEIDPEMAAEDLIAAADLALMSARAA